MFGDVSEYKNDIGDFPLFISYGSACAVDAYSPTVFIIKGNKIIKPNRKPRASLVIYLKAARNLLAAENR